MRAGRGAPAVPAAELLPEVRVAPRRPAWIGRLGTGPRPGPHSPPRHRPPRPGQEESGAQRRRAGVLHLLSPGPPALRRGTPSHGRGGLVPAPHPPPPFAGFPYPPPGEGPGQAWRGPPGPVLSPKASRPEVLMWSAGIRGFLSLWHRSTRLVREPVCSGGSVSSAQEALGRDK